MASLLRSVLSILSGRVATILIQLGFTPILVRIISQEQYGLYASVLAGFSLLALVSKGGLFDASRKIVADNVRDSRETSLTTSVSLVLGVTYGLVAVAFVAVAIYAGLVPAGYTRYLWVLAGALLFENVFQVVRGAFYGTQREHAGEVLGVARQVLYATVGLVLAYVGYDLVGVFAGYTLSFVVVALVGVAALRRYVPFALPSFDDLTTRGREIATFGGYQLVGGLSAAFLYRADILLVEYFRGSSSTALYNSALVPAEMIWFVPSVIQLAFLQHTASLWADDDVETINEHIETGVKYGMLSLTLFGVGLFALAEPFLGAYFGPEYVEAATALQILIFGTFFFGISRVVVPVFQATGWIRQTELVTVVALVLNLALNLVLIPRYGIVGAGTGTALSYSFIFFGNLAIWVRSPFAVVSLGWTARLVLVQGAFAAAFLGLVSVTTFSPLVSLLALPPAGLLLFVAVNVAAGYLPLSPVVSRLRSALE